MKTLRTEKPTNVAQLRELLSRHGYTLVKVIRFKRKDRVVIRSSKGVTITLYLRTKLEKIPLSWWENLLNDWHKA